MEFTKLKELLEEYKHILIDYTDKFINTDYNIQLDNNKYTTKASQIYLEIDDKTKEDKYKNVVFLLDISKLVKYNHNFYMLLVKIGDISPKTDVYFLKNCDNFCWFKIDEFEMNKKMIIDIINQKNESYECNVCFEEKKLWYESEFCKKCNFRTCIKCIVKSGESYKTCFSCKNDNSDKYEFVHNVLLKKVSKSLILKD